MNHARNTMLAAAILMALPTTASAQDGCLHTRPGEVHCPVTPPIVEIRDKAVKTDDEPPADVSSTPPITRADPVIADPEFTG